VHPLAGLQEIVKVIFGDDVQTAVVSILPKEVEVADKLQVVD
jgi:hypothetical protein